MEKPPKTDRVIGADRIRPISETPQIELKLTPRLGHHTSSPPLEVFGVTTPFCVTRRPIDKTSPVNLHIGGASVACSGITINLSA